MAVDSGVRVQGKATKRERETNRVANIFSSEAENEQRWRDRRKMRDKGREVKTGLSCPVDGWQPRKGVMKEKKEIFFLLCPSPPLSLSCCVTRSVSPFGFNQADSWSDPFGGRGEGGIYHQQALICVTGAY